MYQLVSAIVKPLDGNARWRATDIGDIALRDLFGEFKRVVATLSNSVLTQNVSLDIESLRSQLGGSDQTFKTWLVSNGNATLPTSNVLPVINTRYAEFSDAVRSGYKVKPVDINISETVDLPLADRPDLLVTKDGEDYPMVQKCTLVNINGFYHATDASSAGLYVMGGNKTSLYSGRNEIGLLSFRKLGNLEYYPITDGMIYAQKTNEQLRYNCYVDIGVDVSQKTVMLVLGGYLHVLDKQAFFRISATGFGIDFSQIPLLDRYFESRKVLDLSSLGLEVSPNSPDQIAINDLFSDAVLRKYLQLTQTFFVVLDNPDIFLDVTELRPSPWPGCYTSHIQPIYPLLVGHGKHEVFWPREETDRYSVNINGAWDGTKNYSTVKTNDANSVADGELPVLGYKNASAHFLMIGSDV